MCVKEAVVDALERGYRTVLLSDLTRPVDPDAGQEALELVQSEGAEVS